VLRAMHAARSDDEGSSPILAARVHRDRKQASEQRMQPRWGEEMPNKGLLFAMGTHSQYPNTWLINGLIQMSEVGQLALDL
jgi:hypothetical protein